MPPKQHGERPFRYLAERQLFDLAYAGRDPGRKCRGLARPAPLAEKTLVAPHQADELALDLDAVRPENACLVSLVGRLQRNRIPAPAQSFQGYLVTVDEGHHDGAVLGRIAALDQDGVAVED